MPINVWDYLREYDELRDEILAAVDRVFRSGRLILGQEGVKFEREMAAYLGVADGVGVNSGTDAIYIALASLIVASKAEWEPSSAKEGPFAATASPSVQTHISVLPVMTAPLFSARFGAQTAAYWQRMVLP